MQRVHTPDFAIKPMKKAIQAACLSAAIVGLSSPLAHAQSVSSQQNLSQQTQARSYQVDIPAEALSQVLGQFAAATGTALSFDATHPAFAEPSAGLKGHYTLEQGFSYLLKNTQISWQITGKDAVILKVSAASAELDKLEIHGRQMTTDGRDTYLATEGSSATGLDLSLVETPQSVSIITRQKMDDLGLNSVDGVLEHTTGITLRRSETDRAFPKARGFDISHINIDGLPVDIGYNTRGSIGGDLFADTSVYDRVEVIRGAAGVLQGAANPSASINLIRKRPTDDFQASARVSAGRWDNRRIQGDLSGRLNQDGSLRGRLVAAHTEKESHVRYYDKKQKVIYGVAEYDLSNTTQIGAGIDYQKSDVTGVTFGEPVPLFFSDGSATHFPHSTTTGAPWSFKNSENQTAFVDLNHQFDNGWKLKAAFSHMKTDLQSNQFYMSGMIDKDTGTGFSGFMLPLDFDRDGRTFSIMADGPFSLFGRDHSLMVGWNHIKEDLRFDRFAPGEIELGSFYDWAPEYNGYNRNQYGGYDIAETRHSGAFFTSRWSLTDPLTLMLGSRLRHWDYTMTVNDEVLNKSSQDNIFIPYVALSYQLSTPVTLYASMTEVFEPQSLRDRHGDLLPPVEGTNYEAGVKSELMDGDLQASFAVFNVQQDNISEFDTIIDGDYRYKAQEGISVNGFETELTGRISPDLQVSAGYTFREAENADGSKASTEEPEQMLRLSGKYQFAGALNKLRLGGALRWQSKACTDNVARSGFRAEQKAYSVVDMMVRYDFTPSLSAQLNVNNLFDKTYLSATPVYVGGNYGEPRNATLSLEATF